MNVETLERRLLLSASPLTPGSHENGPTVPEITGGAVGGELLVGFKAGVSNQQIRGLYQAHGMTELEQLYNANDVRRVRVPEQAADAVAKALANNPMVQYAEPNFVASTFFQPNDPLYPYQWHLTNSDEGGINVETAWDTTSGAGVVVAVLDTGVAYENHRDSTGDYYVAPDLANSHFVPGYDFINNDAHANDDHSHGTHVAGTIAQSTDNSKGVSGVAFDASVMPVKVLGQDGSGTYSAIANGIRWSADNGADVINLSLGADSPSKTLEDALAYAYGQGVTIVAAAGNGGKDGVSYPAAYDEYVIAVSATRYDEQLAPYSNYGSGIDLAAPGGDLSVDQNGDGHPDGVLQNTFNPSTKDTSAFNYWFFEGTSMAAPHVAGVAALVVSQGVTDPSLVREALQASAKDKGPTGVDIYYGHGIVDAAGALAWLESNSTPTNTAPTANDDTVTTDEDHAVVIDVLSNDGDPDGDAVSISSVTQPSGGSVTINPDDSLTYFPNTDSNGSDSFAYTISDGNGGTDTATVTVTVNPVNDAPVAGDDFASTEVNAPVTIDVLANDRDVDGDVLSISSVTQPSKGSVTINPDDSLTYSPEADTIGSDSFTYTISDGNGGTDTATVAIDVQAANSMHVADLDGSTDVKGKSGRWEAFVLAIIHDANDDPVGGASVTGSWSGAFDGMVTGTTASDGTVIFSTGSIRGGSSVTFSVANVSGDLNYDPDSNHDPDGDSDGTTITVNKDGSTSSALAVSMTGTTSADTPHRSTATSDSDTGMLDEIFARLPQRVAVPDLSAEAERRIGRGERLYFGPPADRYDQAIERALDEWLSDAWL